MGGRRFLRWAESSPAAILIGPQTGAACDVVPTPSLRLGRGLGSGRLKETWGRPNHSFWVPGCRGHRVGLLRSMRKMLAAVSRVLAGAAQKPVRPPDPGRLGWGSSRPEEGREEGGPDPRSARPGVGDELRSSRGPPERCVSPRPREERLEDGPAPPRLPQSPLAELLAGSPAAPQNRRLL